MELLAELSYIVEITTTTYYIHTHTQTHTSKRIPANAIVEETWKHNWDLRDSNITLVVIVEGCVASWLKIGSGASNLGSNLTLSFSCGKSQLWALVFSSVK